MSPSTSVAPPRRGIIHSTKVGKELSSRRQQELRKYEKERMARETREDLRGGVKPTKIQDFFSRAPVIARQLVPEPVLTVDALDSDDPTAMDIDLGPELPSEKHSVVDEAPIVDMDLGPSAEPSGPLPQHCATVEEVDGEDDDLISVEPCALSPEARADLQDILHPRRATGHGHKKMSLDLVTSARMECIIRFLRLYKSSGYAGWTLHSETVATASGKTGSKT
ncbi:hypothetical protein B0H14DRAFT_3526177 [Mycena olivaceomarginata]|nr:hypothetical protein B0H14DRAFT_3526177 [Mycena olivaceomarginata]